MIPYPESCSQVLRLDYTEVVNVLLFIASVAVLASSLLLSSTRPIAHDGSQDPGRQSSSTSNAKKASAQSAPSAQEIADAKSKGLVWVNLSTHVYHKDGPLYGNTKRGKFMAEDDAKKAGYRLAQDKEGSGTSKSSKPR